MNGPRRNPQSGDILLLLFALTGTVLSAIFALFLLILQLWGEADPQSAQSITGLLGAYSFGLMALLGLPAVFVSAWTILWPPGPRPRRPSRISPAIILLYPLAIYLGYLSFYRQVAPALLSPVAQTVAAGVPVLFAIHLVRRFGPPLSPRRLWSQFLAGLWVVPPTALVLEAMLLIPTLLVVIGGMTLSEEGRILLESLRSQTALSMESVMDQMAQLVFQPWFVVVLLLFVSVGVPLIEEALKTLPAWPLLFRKASPAEFYLGGVLGGAGYALFEALFLTAPGEDWLVTIIARGGATMMHAFASGLAAWGLGQGSIKGRWKRTLGCYALAVAIHGLWNATAVGIGLVQFADLSGNSSAMARLMKALQPIFPGVLVAFSITALITLPWASRYLTERQQNVDMAASELAPPPYRDRGND